MPTLAPRLADLAGARIAVLRNKKLGSEAVAQTIASALETDYHARTRTWVKPSPYSPISRKIRREVVEWADGVVACPGDCGHGSAVLRHDIFALEAEGVPVSWIDTPGRMPKVTRTGRSFDISYNALKYLVGDVRKHGGIDTPAGRASAINAFEKFGLHRALRLAGAKPGDTVRVPGLEVTLWDYPPTILEGWDGVPEFPYVEIPSLRATSEDQLREWVAARVADVARLLVRLDA